MLENNPKITIVTATFNLIKNKRQKLFMQSFESVIKQSYKNIEYLIMDGNSTDGTIKYLKEYEKKGLLRIYVQKDKGVYDAFNHALKKATGDFILYLGSDDFLYANDVIEKSVKYILRANADWGYGDTLYLDTDGNLFPWKGTLNAIPFGSAPCHQSILVKTDIMKQIGGFDIKNSVADIDVMMKLIKNNYKSIYIPAVISIFREGGTSSNTEVNKKWKNDFIKSFHKLFGKEFGLSLEECNLLYAGNCFNKLKNNKLSKIAFKLRKSEWIKAFINKDCCILNTTKPDFNPHKTRTFCIFHIPVLKYKSQMYKKKIYLLEIPVIKIKTSVSRIVFYILGIPVIKIKQ